MITLIAALARSNQNDYSESTMRDSTLSEEYRVSYFQTFISTIDLWNCMQVQIRSSFSRQYNYDVTEDSRIISD